jgi:hypothetical protein
MSIQLDWEIEDVESPLPESPPEPGQNASGCRRWVRLSAVAVLVLAVALAVFGLRLRERQKENLAAFRAAVDLELKALIEGDRDLFLNRQDPDDSRWGRVQESTFNDYHSLVRRNPWEDLPEAPEYTGRVPFVDVQQDYGQAQVEVKWGDQTWRELWFYEWTRENGWRHVRFDENWLGEEKALATSHLHFIFRKRDAAIVSALAREMEEWYNLLAPLVGVRPTSSNVLTVRFEYRSARSTPNELFWIRNSSTLVGPSPHQGRLTADGRPNPLLRRQMATRLAEALIAQQSGTHPNEQLAAEVNALRDELRDWAVGRIAAQEVTATGWDLLPTPLIDALVVQYSTATLANLVAILGQAPDLKEALASAGLNPPDPGQRFAFAVAAVERARHEQNQNTLEALLDPRAGGSWRRNRLSELEWHQEVGRADGIWPALSALRIESVVFNGDIAWVETETTQSNGAIYRQTYFFRSVDGQWLLTAPDPAYFGEPQEMRMENLVLKYYERETEWVERYLVTLQPVLRQFAADLGIPRAGVVITVETEIQSDNGYPSQDSPQSVRILSPAVEGWRVDSRDSSSLEIILQLLGVLFERRIQGLVQDNMRFLMAYYGAFLWELERLFPQDFDSDVFFLGVGANNAPLPALNDLWLEPDTEDDAGVLRYLNGFRTLFLFLAKTYGPQVVPSLIDHLSHSEDLDAWLRTSTGSGLDEIAPLWQAWISENYGPP